MRIIDKRKNSTSIKEYKLGSIYTGDGYTFMVVQCSDNEFQLINLPTGQPATDPEPTLKDLYRNNYFGNDQLVNAELVLKDGEDE